MQRKKNVCFPGNDFSFIPFDEYKQKIRAKEPIHAKTIQHHIKKMTTNNFNSFNSFNENNEIKNCTKQKHKYMEL